MINEYAFPIVREKRTNTEFLSRTLLHILNITAAHEITHKDTDNFLVTYIWLNTQI
jgi:hypothetical protein